MLPQWLRKRLRQTRRMAKSYTTIWSDLTNGWTRLCLFSKQCFCAYPRKKVKKLFVWCLYACVQQKKPFKWLFRRWMERLNWTELSQEKKGLCYKRTSEVDLVQGLSKHCPFPAPKKNEPIRLPWGIKCQPSKKGAGIFKACGGMGHVTSWNIGCLTE